MRLLLVPGLVVVPGPLRWLLWEPGLLVPAPSPGTPAKQYQPTGNYDRRYDDADDECNVGAAVSLAVVVRFAGGVYEAVVAVHALAQVLEPLVSGTCRIAIPGRIAVRVVVITGNVRVPIVVDPYTLLVIAVPIGGHSRAAEQRT